MKTTLRLTIQFAWAYLGLLGCCAVASLLWGAFFARVPLPFAHGEWVWRISNTCATIFGFLLLGMFIRFAWRAVFRFSQNIVTLTVCVAGIIMLFLFLHGEHQYIRPLVTAHIRSGGGPFVPLIDLAVSVVSLVGYWKFLR